jgi:O-antigen ligase
LSAQAAAHSGDLAARRASGGFSPRPYLLATLTIGLALSISLAQASLVLLALWELWRGRPEHGGRFRWPLLGVFGAYIAWSILAALLSERPFESLVSAKSVGWLCAMYIVCASLPDARAARRFATGVFAAVTVVALLSIVQVGVCPPPAAADAGHAAALTRFFRKCERAHGFYSIYMTLAGVLTVVLAATLPRLAGFGRRTWLVALGWLAGVAALGLTFVRGAWIAFAVAVVAGVVTLRRHTAVLVGLTAFAVVVAVALPGVLDRARSIGDVRDGTTRERLAMLDAGLRLARAYPLTGIGPGQVKYAYPVWAPPEAARRSTSHLHNTPLQVLVERGVPGLVLWVTIWVAFFTRAFRIAAALPAGPDRALVIGCMVGIAAFLVGGLFEYNFGDTEVLLVAVIFMALPFVMERQVAR